MLSNRDEHLASKVTTLLDTRLLVLNMDTASTSIDEHLDEFHHGSDATETSISICNAGNKEIDLLGLLSLLGSQVKTFIILLAVMEELSRD